MPKLPDNLVKPPVSVFDNPLRRTGHAMKHDEVEGSRDAVSSTTGLVIPIGGVGGANEHATRIDAKHENANATPPRITLRIDDSIRCALETECHKRRLAGEKTNLADVARGILSAWASR